MDNNLVFLFKENTEDRDCVKYMELKNIRSKHLCIDGKFNVTGACFSMTLNNEFVYENVKTILTKEEFEMLQNPKSEMNFDLIIGKLLSYENQKLFEEIIEEEKEYLYDEYSLDEDDIEMIFDEYYLDYRDRGIVGSVWDDIIECAEEEAWSCGYVTKENERWFSYEKFGDDLLEDERYLELSDGRIVILNY